jgi:hypothetical protein
VRVSPKAFKIFDSFLPTRAGLVADQRARRTREAPSFGQHSLGLAFLRLAELRGDDNETQVDHEERADDDETHEIDPVPERVRVLNVIHDVHPALETDDLGARGGRVTLAVAATDTYLEDDDPGEADVVEADRARVRIPIGDVAELIVLVPVDALVDGLVGIVGQLFAVRVKVEFTRQIAST